MDTEKYLTTRNALHAIAEYVMAAPQYAQSKTIRLQAIDGGFGTVAEPGLQVAGDLLVYGSGATLTVNGRTFRDLATAAGVPAGDLRGLYADGPALGLDDVITVDAASAYHLGDCLAAGASALAQLAPGQTPVLWPEHFDLAITLDAVNYGVSPGDSYLPQPYAYVGPHDLRSGEFWAAPFGAARALSEPATPAEILGFYREAQTHL